MGGRAISHVISCTARTGVPSDIRRHYAFQGFLWYIVQLRIDISGEYCTERVMNITLFSIRMLFFRPRLNILIFLLI